MAVGNGDLENILRRKSRLDGVELCAGLIEDADRGAFLRDGCVEENARVLLEGAGDVEGFRALALRALYCGRRQ